MLPEKFGRYEIQAELGRGRFSRVYRARDPILERLVAIKAYEREPVDAEALVGLFRRAASLRHFAITPVYDFGFLDKKPYLVMEYMPGGSLADRLKARMRIPEYIAVPVTQRIADALGYVNNLGLVLDDFNPNDIVFDQHGDAALCEFGLAGFHGKDLLTSQDEFLRWPAYLSPEQLQADLLDSRSNVYSLGCILYEMLSSRPPYPAGTSLDEMLKHVYEPVPPIRELVPELPPGIEAALTKALAKNPLERFSNASEFGKALGDDIKASPPFGLSDTAVMPSPVPMAPPPSPSMAPPSAPDTVPLRDTTHPGWTKAKPPGSPPVPAPSPRPGIESSGEAPRRVLNANFADERGRVLGLDEYLRPAKACSLWVDVGLPWVIPNLLQGKANFPEDSRIGYLSPEDRQKGWFDVEVVFVSQDFEPNLVSGRMRIAGSGLETSSPYIDGKPGAPGPLKLALHTPGNPGRARGRLCLYYGAQVLQSAVVDVGIRGWALFSKPAHPARNTALVDYVLTSGFENVSADLSRRQRQGRDGRVVETTVKVGLMLNDDQSGTHRILLKVDDQSDENPSLPPAWKSYDAVAIGSTLEEARRILTNPSEKEPDYTKDTFLRDKFKDDMAALARLGANLHSMLLQGVTPAEHINPMVWRQKFRSALQPGEVIQMARAGSVPSTHVIPWALVYDYPLEPGRGDLPLKFCRVIDEQWDGNSASRKQPFREQEISTCPYEHEHEANTVCPFGFWGYKYTLEQPISALIGKSWDVEPARRVLAGTPVKMAVAATLDVSRASRWQKHFELIRGSLNAEYLPSAPAEERDQVRDSLRAPQLVYILCHGGKDGKITTLSIGPRDNDARHTLTPALPGNWGELNYLDLEKWAETRPLVFINGCFTTDLLPELALDFVSAFRDLMAGGVIGTEIPVSVEFGYQAAEKFFERLGSGEDVGKAILGMRWDLLNNGSFLGLAYTPYCMSDLHLQKS